MALTVPQTAHTAMPPGGGITVAATLPNMTVIGNALVAIVNGYDGAPVVGSITDSRANTWTLDYLSPTTLGTIWTAVYSTILTAAGAAHVVTFTQAGINIANIDVAEVASMAGAGRVDKTVVNGATSVSPHSTGLFGTLAQADEILFASIGVDISTTAGFGHDAAWVLIGEQPDGTGDVSSVVYKIVAATTSIAHVWTSTMAASPWITVGLSYKGAVPLPIGTISVVEALDVAVIAGNVVAPPGTISVTEDPDTITIVGTVTNPTPTFRYPVAVSGRKFIDQLGGVFLVKDISSWAMGIVLSNTDITTALQGAASRHFNTVLVGIGAHPFGDWGDGRHNVATGLSFWTGTAWASSLGPAWASFDWIMSEATRLGLVVAFSFEIMTPGSGMEEDLQAVTLTNAFDAGVAIATRYAAVPNIIWHIEGESGFSATNATGQRMDQIFRGIRQVEGANPRPIIAEPYLDGDGYGMFISQQLDHGNTGGYQWLKLASNSLYKYTGNSVEEFDNIWNTSGATTYPVWDCEPPYSGAGHYDGQPFVNPGPVERQNMRERNLSVIIRGGIGVNWGHEAWWPFGKTGLFAMSVTWPQVPARPETLDAQYCWDLVDVYCADTSWVPDNTSLTSGTGTGDTKAAVGHSSTALLAYFPTSRTPITIDTATAIVPSGNVRLRWYDPSLGTYATIAASEAQNASRTVTYPGTAHADGSNDYVLVVDLDPGTNIIGVVAVIEATDTTLIAGTFVGSINVSGDIAITEATDTTLIAGTVSAGPVTGVIAITEASDTAIIVGYLPGVVGPSGPLIVTVQAWPPALSVEVTDL